MPDAVERRPRPATLSGKVGRYRIVRRLSVGGMAEVYLARVRGPHGFDRAVVLKRMRPELAASGSFRRMFADEARVSSHLHHANIAQVFDVGETGGELFLVMEYVEGRDLAAVLEASSERGAVGLPIEVVMTVAMEAAAGLHYAHERRDDSGRPLEIVHRDVSPPNLLISFGGHTKVADFGVAKARQARTITKVGAIKGKMPYMSPEQVQGLSLDRRSDLFSLGAVLHEMLTGHLAFDGASDAELVYRILTEEPAPMAQHRADVPRALADLVARLLTKDVDARPASAEEVQLELERIARNEQLAFSPVTVARTMRDLFGEPVAEPMDDELDPVDATPPPDEPLTASVSLDLDAGAATGEVDAESDDFTRPNELPAELVPAVPAREHTDTITRLDPRRVTLGAARRTWRRPSGLMLGAVAVALASVALLVAVSRSGSRPKARAGAPADGASPAGPAERAAASVPAGAPAAMPASAPAVNPAVGQGAATSEPAPSEAATSEPATSEPATPEPSPSEPSKRHHRVRRSRERRHREPPAPARSPGKRWNPDSPFLPSQAGGEPADKGDRP